MPRFAKSITFPLNLFVMLSTMAMTCVANSQEVWRIASLEWKPYSGSTLANQGSAIEKLRDLLEQHNIMLEVDFLPWKRAIKIVQNDQRYLGIYPAWPEDVFSNATISSPIACSTIGIFTHTGRNASFSSINELFKRNTVGIVRAYSYPDAIEQAIERYPAHVSRAHNVEQLVKMLGAKRHDAAISDPNVVAYYSQQLAIKNIKHVANLENKKLVLIMSQHGSNQQRIKRFQEITSLDDAVLCAKK